MKKKITFIKIAPHKSIPLKIQVSICLCRHRLPPKQFCKSPPFKTSTPRYVEMWLLASPRYDLFSCNNFPQCVSAAKKLSEYVNPGFSYNFLHKYQDGKFDAWPVLYTIFITNLTVMVLFFFDQYSFFCSCICIRFDFLRSTSVNYL